MRFEFTSVFYSLLRLLIICYMHFYILCNSWFTGLVSGETSGDGSGQPTFIVSVVTDPAGIPVGGQPSTFDYPILSNVTLTCNVAATGASANVTSYRWTATNCYDHIGGIQDLCFYSGGLTGQNISGSDLLAQDAGDVSCTATIDGSNYTSDPLTFQISGEQLSRMRFEMMT